MLSGGVALQEIISSQMVGQGQMMRRERTYEGIKVDYVYLDESQTANALPQFNLADKHSLICDKVTAIVRAIIDLQRNHIKQAINHENIRLAQEQSSAQQHVSLVDATINNTPEFSGVFQLIYQ